MDSVINTVYHLVGACGEHALTHPSPITVLLVVSLVVLGYSVISQGKLQKN